MTTTFCLEAGLGSGRVPETGRIRRLKRTDPSPSEGLKGGLKGGFKGSFKPFSRGLQGGLKEGLKGASRGLEKSASRGLQGGLKGA